MRILVTAGEPSGDLHGGKVVAALHRRWPDAQIDAVGGPCMAEAGAHIRHPIDRLAAIGLVEVLGKIPAHWRLERTLVRDFKARIYDLYIPIDYPGFHGRLARAARANGIPVLWYIAPQLWGWRPGRATRFAKTIDRLAVILPFEAEFFARAGMRADFVGHPLLDADPPPTRSSARQALGIPDSARVLTLFPGSRPPEIARLWPVMRDAARQLQHEGHCDTVLVAAASWAGYPGSESFRVIIGQPVQLLAAADTVVAKSGTTTLQAAIVGVPMVVVYSVHAFSATLLRRLLTSRWVSLPNLIAGREVVPELLQERLSVASIVSATAPLLDARSAAAQAQRDGLREVCCRLGGPGASERVAALAGELLAA